MKIASHKTMHDARLYLDGYLAGGRLFVAVAPPNALGSLFRGLKKAVADCLNRGEVRRQKLMADLDLAVKSINQDILWKLASHPDPEVRGAVAENPRIDPRTQALLSADKKAGVVASLTRNPGLTPDRERVLAVHPHPLVRSELARQTGDPEILALLAFDEKHEVRAAVSASAGKSTNAQTFERLAGDQSPAVLQALASNANCPRDILEKLAMRKPQEGSLLTGRYAIGATALDTLREVDRQRAATRDR